MRLITKENSKPEEFEKYLRFVCEPVEKVTPLLQRVALEMLSYMYKKNAIGLAANQVGLKIRLCVMDPAWMYDRKLPIVMFNPEVVAKDEEQYSSPEGCLSLPNVSLYVPRFRNVEVKYLGFDGQSYTIRDDNSLLSSVMQHEIDHLNAKLFTDLISDPNKQDLKND